jgi:hypothetical protein
VLRRGLGGGDAARKYETLTWLFLLPERWLLKEWRRNLKLKKIEEKHGWKIRQ